LAVNEVLAQRAAAVYELGDIIFIHDYQLAAVATSVRELRADVPIVHFVHIVHIAFGEPDERWAGNFLRCCAALGFGLTGTAM